MHSTEYRLLARASATPRHHAQSDTGTAHASTVPAGGHACQLLGVVLLFISQLHTGFAAPVLPLSDQTGSYTLGPYLDYQIDPDGQLSLAQVRQPTQSGNFQPVNSTSPNFGFTHATYWLRLRTTNTFAQTRHWLLESRYAPLDQVDIYIIYADGRIQHMQGGDRYPFTHRQHRITPLIFDLDVPPGQPMDIYIRIRSEGSLQIPLYLWQPDAFLKYQHDLQLVFGIYNGLLIAMLLYNFLLYLSLRDANYLYYVLYIIGATLFQLSINGQAFEYIWPSLPWWANHATPFTIAFSLFWIVQFSRAFLRLEQTAPLLDRGFRLCLGLSATLGIAALALDYSLVMKIATVLATFIPLLIFYAGIHCLHKGYKPARYYLLAWSLLLAGIVAYALKTFGVLPKLFITEYAMQIGLALEVLMLSFALAYRMRLLRDENEQIQRDAALTLEQQVNERTQALNTALDALSHTNRALHAQSRIDGLTGVRNRHDFDARLLQEWRKAQRAQYPLALLMLDLDHFKSINDNYGHLIGDETLRRVASIIADSLQRPDDMVARYGGEEFSVLLPDTEAQGAHTLAEAIRRGIAGATFTAQGKNFHVTISIGIAVVIPTASARDGHQGGNALIAAADRALYQAKLHGRNQVQLADAD